MSFVSSLVTQEAYVGWDTVSVLQTIPEVLPVASVASSTAAVSSPTSSVNAVPASSRHHGFFVGRYKCFFRFPGEDCYVCRVHFTIVEGFVHGWATSLEGDWAEFGQRLGRSAKTTETDDNWVTMSVVFSLLTADRSMVSWGCEVPKPGFTILWCDSVRRDLCRTCSRKILLEADLNCQLLPEQTVKAVDRSRSQASFNSDLQIRFHVTVDDRSCFDIFCVPCVNESLVCYNRVNQNLWIRRKFSFNLRVYFSY